MKTFDIINANNIKKGFNKSFKDCIDFIQLNNNTKDFYNFSGGYVSVVCNETGDCYYKTTIQLMSKLINN